MPAKRVRPGDLVVIQVLIEVRALTVGKVVSLVLSRQGENTVCILRDDGRRRWKTIRELEVLQHWSEM